MDPVGDPEDPVGDHALPGCISGFHVELAYRVGGACQTQREGSHVELVGDAVHPTTELEDPLDRDAAGAGAPVAVEQGTRDAADEIALEALVAG